METVAVFNEHPVQTYGILLRHHLALLEARGDDPRPQVLAQARPPLEMIICAAAWQEGEWWLKVCLPAEAVPRLQELAPAAGLRPEAPRPVSLLVLQGPHFGDRPGIAAAALAGLEQAGVEPLLLQGAVHSLMLAVEPAQAARAREGLGAYFSVPE